MIGEDVGVDHIVDLEPGFRRDLDVGTRIGNGIDDRADPPAPATKEVRDADGSVCRNWRRIISSSPLTVKRPSSWLDAWQEAL